MILKNPVFLCIHRMDTKNLLYLMPPFKPVASHLRASFVDILLQVGLEHAQHVWLARDAMGLCWVHFTEPFPPGRATVVGYDDSADQTFRSWFPLQIQIQTRASRVHLLNSIFSEIVAVATEGVYDYCLPRCGVYRIGHSSSLAFHYEIVNGSNREWIAEHIGNRERLLSDDIIDRGFLQPPVRLRIPDPPTRSQEEEEDDSDHDSNDSLS